MQTDFRLDIMIFGNSMHGTVALTTENVLAFETSYLNTPTASCSAGSLQLQSYLSSSNAAVFGNTDLKLNNQQTNYPAKCFAVPDEVPSADDVASLSLDGQAFCTSYIGYSTSRHLYFDFNIMY